VVPNSGVVCGSEDTNRFNPSGWLSGCPEESKELSINPSIKQSTNQPTTNASSSYDKPSNSQTNIYTGK
jgi:hypothetical protein